MNFLEITSIIGIAFLGYVVLRLIEAWTIGSFSEKKKKVKNKIRKI